MKYIVIYFGQINSIPWKVCMQDGTCFSHRIFNANVRCVGGVCIKGIVLIISSEYLKIHSSQAFCKSDIRLHSNENQSKSRVQILVVQ